MNQGSCPFTEFDLFHSAFGLESVILGIYSFLESVRYWAGLAELWLGIRLHLQFSCDFLNSTKARLENIRVTLDSVVLLCLDIVCEAWV